MRHTHATERVMQQIREKDKAKEKEKKPPPVATHTSTAAASSSAGAAGAAGSSSGGAAPRWMQTTSACAAGFTSTTLTPCAAPAQLESRPRRSARGPTHALVPPCSPRPPRASLCPTAPVCGAG